jgi:hypothetical protein
MVTNWKLSPSELTFLWDECQRCFYLKVVRGFNRPRSLMPKIFTRIDKLMKDYFEGKQTADVYPGLPEGEVRFAEKWVKSVPVYLPAQEKGCYIRGKFDTVVEFDDGSYGIVDFKTTEPSPAHVPFYARQLQAYAFALENPAPGSLSLSPISRLGLLCVEPVIMKKTTEGQVGYYGETTWLEIPKDDQSFREFLTEVLTLLNQPEPPDANPQCVYCQYLDTSRQLGI